MQVVSADLVVADLATELELSFREANEYFDRLCDSEDDVTSSIEVDD